MDFLQKLDFMMKKYSLNKRTLSQNSGIPYTTIDGWYKKGYEGMKISTLRILASYFNTVLDFWIQDNITDPNYGKSAFSEKKSPSTAEATPGGDRISMEESNRLLVALGLIEEGQDLSDDDLSFLTHIIGLLDSWFGKRK